MSEPGFTVTSNNVFGLPYSSVKGKPSIVVSSKGLANGTSNIPNDGADFGPDSLQADGSATQTSGLQEAMLSSNGQDITIRIFGEIKLNVPVTLPATNVTILGSLYNINTNGINPTRGASAIVASSSFSGDYLIQTPSISNYAFQLHIEGILFGGYDIATMSQTSTPSSVSGVLIGNGYPHLYIDYCKFTLLYNGVVVNSGGGPKYIGHTHWTYVGNYGVVINTNDELVLDSPEFFCDGNANPNGYIYAQGSQTTSGAIRISNANFANTFKCNLGAIVYGNVSLIQISNSFIDGGYAFAPVYLSSNNYAGKVMASNLVYGNNYSGTYESLINITSSTPLITSIDISDMTYAIFPASSGTTFYLFYQQSAAAYQPDFIVSIHNMKVTGGGLQPLPNLTLDNVGKYAPNIELDAIQTQLAPFYVSASGTTAGTVAMQASEYRSNYKKYIITFTGYENDTTTDQTIDFPQAFTSYAGASLNTTGLTVSASTSGITITAPDSTTTYSGIVIVEGY